MTKQFEETKKKNNKKNNKNEKSMYPNYTNV